MSVAGEGRRMSFGTQKERRPFELDFWDCIKTQKKKGRVGKTLETSASSGVEGASAEAITRTLSDKRQTPF